MSTIEEIASQLQEIDKKINFYLHPNDMNPYYTDLDDIAKSMIDELLDKRMAWMRKEQEHFNV